jgi:calcineurin-like phosphoesterase family protein
MTIWFTSDTHFGHRKLLTFDPTKTHRVNRRTEFTSIEEHDAHLVDQWCLSVQPEDTVYHLGDVSWYGTARTNDLLNSLPGRKHLIRGNHDHKAHKLTAFESVRDYATLPGFAIPIVLMHFPLEEWDRKAYGAIHVHGHTHGNSRYIEGRKDVGVDCHPHFGLFKLEDWV